MSWKWNLKWLMSSIYLKNLATQKHQTHIRKSSRRKINSSIKTKRREKRNEKYMILFLFFVFIFVYAARLHNNRQNNLYSLIKTSYIQSNSHLLVSHIIFYVFSFSFWFWMCANINFGRLDTSWVLFNYGRIVLWSNDS